SRTKTARTCWRSSWRSFPTARRNDPLRRHRVTREPWASPTRFPSPRVGRPISEVRHAAPADGRSLFASGAVRRVAKQESDSRREAPVQPKDPPVFGDQPPRRRRRADARDGNAVVEEKDPVVFVGIRTRRVGAHVELDLVKGRTDPVELEGDGLAWRRNAEGLV